MENFTFCGVVAQLAEIERDFDKKKPCPALVSNLTEKTQQIILS